MGTQLQFKFDFNYGIFPEVDPQKSLLAYLQMLEASVQDDTPIFFNSSYHLADCVKIIRERLKFTKIV